MAPMTTKTVAAVALGALAMSSGASAMRGKGARRAARAPRLARESPLGRLLDGLSP